MGAAEFIHEELTEKDGAVRLKLGGFDCAYYKKDIEQGCDKLIVCYLAVGEKNSLFISSLMIDKEQEQKAINEEVLDTVQNKHQDKLNCAALQAVIL